MLLRRPQTRVFVFMTNLSTKIASNFTSAKKSVGAFMLTSLALSQSVFAQPTELQEPAPEPTVVAAEEVQPTVQEVLLHVCEERGYSEDCAKTLLGMLWTESSNRSTIIGDNGKARGYFQIHYKLHKTTTDCAEDLVCSANWTLTYLESNHYPKYVNYAIQCHNGCNANNGYVNKVKRYAAMFWNQPLTIEQATPIKLAMN
jgi:hypothetical protein